MWNPDITPAILLHFKCLILLPCKECAPAPHSRCRPLLPKPSVLSAARVHRLQPPFILSSVLQVLHPSPAHPHQPSPTAAHCSTRSQFARGLAWPPATGAKLRSHASNCRFGLLAFSHTAHSSGSHFSSSTPLLSVALVSSPSVIRQVLYTEFRAARAQIGGNGSAFVAAMALLALAAAASAADASGLACR